MFMKIKFMVLGHGKFVNRVWHPGLLYKLKKRFPDNIWAKICIINSGVPQDIHIRYTIVFTHTYTVTYADDTLVIASSKNRLTASNYLQESLTSIENRMKKLRIKANEIKSVQSTLQLRNEICPPVKLNNSTLPQLQDVKYLGLHLHRSMPNMNSPTDE